MTNIALKIVGNLRKRRGGFTLVELSVYFAIFSILLLILTSIFASSLESQIESESLSSAEQDGRFLLLRLSKDIQRAQDILSPSSIGSSSSMLELSIGSENYIYKLASQNLILEKNAEQNKLNNFNTTISNLNFLRLGNIGGKNTLTVSFTIESKTMLENRRETKNFKTTVGLR